MAGIAVDQRALQSPCTDSCRCTAWEVKGDRRLLMELVESFKR